MAKIEQAVSRWSARKAEKIASFVAIIGDKNTGLLTVSGKNHTIYVSPLSGGPVLQVINVKVVPKFGTPVNVGVDPSLPKVLQVLSYWGVYDDADASVSTPPINPRDLEWPSPMAPYIKGEQFYPSLPVPNGLKLNIYPGNYWTPSGWVRITQITTIDLTSYVPTLASKAKIVLIALSSAGAWVVRDGTEFASSILTGTGSLAGYIPTPLTGDSANCGVILFTGQTEIVKNGYRNHVIDLRFSGVAGGASMSVDLTPYVKRDGSRPFTARQGGIDPTASSDLATKNYVDGADGTLVKKDGSTPFTAAQSGVDPTSSAHLATKSYVDNSITVKEIDGSPLVTGVKVIRVSNGTLTNDGAGQVTIDTGSGGGGTLGSDLIDVSSQVLVGGETHFTFSPAAMGANVMVNGMVQKPSDISLAGDGLSVTLSFGVTLGDNVIVQRLTAPSGGATVSPALKIFLATNFR